MNKRVFNFCVLGIFLVSIVLWIVAKAVEEFYFNAWHLFGLLLTGCGILYEVAAIISRQAEPRARALFNIIGGVLLVVGSVLFGVAYQLAWYYIVGIAAILAIVSVMIRVACKFGKWDQGDNHPGNGTPGDKE